MEVKLKVPKEHSRKSEPGLSENQILLLEDTEARLTT